MASRQSQLPAAFDEHDTYVSGERRLMIAVIIAALNDALGRSADTGPGDGAREHHAQTARQWFERGGRDFQVVCLAAGLEPSQVRAKALAFIDTNSGKERAGVYHSVAAARRETEKPKRERRFSADYIAAVADRAGVSTSTASRVIYGHGNPAPYLTARVHPAIQDIEGEREAA